MSNFNFILWSHHEETRELPEERDSARNNVRCIQARKTTHGLDGQHHRISQPAGDVSHKPGGRLPLLSARPAVTPTNFAAW